jgi:hypothetical protein
MAFLMAVITLGLASLTAASAQYGASAVRETETYTLAQILTHAIEDEYLANARYTIDIEKFGNRPIFTRIAEAEKRHIGLLRPLMAKYGVPVPEDRGAQFVVVPDTLAAALKAGAEGERNNLRMYNFFIKQQLPDDIRVAFTLLRNAAARHMQVFERYLARVAPTPTPGRT